MSCAMDEFSNLTNGVLTAKLGTINATGRSDGLIIGSKSLQKETYILGMDLSVISVKFCFRLKESSPRLITRFLWLAAAFRVLII